LFLYGVSFGRSWSSLCFKTVFELMSKLRGIGMIVATMLVLGGCSLVHSSDEQGGEDIALDVSGTTYAPGDSIDRRLKNGTDGPIGYNLCFARLERRTEEGWRAVQSGDPDSDGRTEGCRAVQRLLAVGGATTDAARLPVDLEAGSYRFTVDVERPDGSTQVVRTGRFTVRD
jgi:hypothetical protein